ncbi:IQ domain-containing protein E isoform X2 [Stigmatopora nigra]
MSAVASDTQTDEDIETQQKKSGKPPIFLISCAGSPYRSSLSMNHRKVALSAWKLPRASFCDTPGGEMGPARFTSLSNNHEMRSEWDLTTEFPRHTLPSRKFHRLTHNSLGLVTVAREKEEMYNEITLLKKSLHEQKSDNQKMKVKLRRLEEDNVKREKQLEELLDPTNRSEYIRSLVDKKHEGSVVINGLKQRILKLEQQCRERETAIGNLQSELRATNLYEMRTTIRNYYEEIQRLRLLLDASEKSGLSESKAFRKQQRALSSTVLRLSEDLKQLQLENTKLREELDTESPAAGIKGYKEWSKHRLLRRLIDLEKRLEERNALKARYRLDQPCQTPSSTVEQKEVQTTLPECLDLAVQTMSVFTVDAVTETLEEDNVSGLKGCLEQLEAERSQLQEELSNNEEEVRWLRNQQQAEEKSRQEHNDEVEELKREKEELEERLERWRIEQTSNREIEQRRHREEVLQLNMEKEQEAEEWRCQMHKERQKQEKKLRQLRAMVQSLKDRGSKSCDAGAFDDEADGVDQDDDGQEGLKPDQENPVFRRKSTSEVLQAGDSTIPQDGETLDEGSLVSIQAAFRGHLARSQYIAQSLQGGASSEFEDNTGATSVKTCLDEEEELLPVSRNPKTLTPTKEVDAVDADSEHSDSDDSDDIIVAESYPRRKREARIM